MSEAAAPVVENKTEAPAAVEATSPADVPKVEETTVSSDHPLLLFMLIVTIRRHPRQKPLLSKHPLLRPPQLLRTVPQSPRMLRRKRLSL